MDNQNQTETTPVKKPQPVMFREAAQAVIGSRTEISRKEIKDILERNPSLKHPAWLTDDKTLRVSRGVYRIPPYVKKQRKPRTPRNQQTAE